MLLWWFIEVWEKVPFVIPALLGLISAEVLNWRQILQLSPCRFQYMI